MKCILLTVVYHRLTVVMSSGCQVNKLQMVVEYSLLFSVIQKVNKKSNKKHESYSRNKVESFLLRHSIFRLRYTEVIYSGLMWHSLQSAESTGTRLAEIEEVVIVVFTVSCQTKAVQMSHRRQRMSRTAKPLCMISLLCHYYQCCVRHWRGVRGSTVC